MIDESAIRPAISSDIPKLIAMDHGVNTDHVWQLALQQGAGEVGGVFREVRLPRPMRVNYPREPNELADEWTQRAALLLAETGETPLGYLSLIDGPAFRSGWVLDLAGYVNATPGIPNPEQPASALLAMRVLIGPVSAVIVLLSFSWGR